MFNTNDLRKKLHVLWNRHCLTVFALVAVVGTSYATMNHADALYILTGVEDSAIVLDDETDTADLSSQLVFLSSNSTGYDVTLTAGRDGLLGPAGTQLPAMSSTTGTATPRVPIFRPTSPSPTGAGPAAIIRPACMQASLISISGPYRTAPAASCRRPPDGVPGD